MITDWHSHWIPPSLAERISRHRPRPLPPEFSGVEARLRYLDHAGVTRQVISFPTTFGLDALVPLAEATELYRAFNDQLGELVRQYPGRFSGLAAVPSADPQMAAAELERAHLQAGLMGAVIPADAFLTPAGAEHYRPLLEVAQRRRSHLYIHPGPTGLKQTGHDPIEFLRVDPSSARWLLETGTRLSAAALTLETSSFLHPYPQVSVHIAMLGGHLGWIAETVKHQSQPENSDPGPAFPLRRIYVDTGIVKPGGQAITQAVAVFGADRILFGTDFPQFGTALPRQAFQEARLPQDEQRKILFENGENLRLGVAAR